MVVRRAATVAISAAMLAGVVAGCSTSGGDDAEPATTTTEAPAEETTTTEAEADLEAVGAEVQDLLDTVNLAVEEEAAARDAFAAENELDSAIDSTRDLRAALYDTDADLRDLDLPDELSEELNALLTANGGYIDALDGFLEVEDIPAYNDQLDLETEARLQWYDAAAELAAALEIDGVENPVDDGSDEPATDEPATDDPVADDEYLMEAGTFAGDENTSLRVPEGFRGTDEYPIRMIDEDGNTIQIFSIADEGPDQTLDDAAAAESAATVEQFGYEVIGGPESDSFGIYPAVAYAYAIDDATTGIDILLEAETPVDRFHFVSITVANEDVDAVLASLEAVADSLRIG